MHGFLCWLRGVGWMENQMDRGTGRLVDRRERGMNDVRGNSATLGIWIHRDKGT